jgi:hypothetical protein
MEENTTKTDEIEWCCIDFYTFLGKQKQHIWTKYSVSMEWNNVARSTRKYRNDRIVEASSDAMGLHVNQFFYGLFTSLA